MKYSVLSTGFIVMLLPWSSVSALGVKFVRLGKSSAPSLKSEDTLDLEDPHQTPVVLRHLLGLKSCSLSVGCKSAI